MEGASNDGFCLEVAETNDRCWDGVELRYENAEEGEVEVLIEVVVECIEIAVSASSYSVYSVVSCLLGASLSAWNYCLVSEENLAKFSLVPLPGFRLHECPLNHAFSEMRLLTLSTLLNCLWSLRNLRPRNLNRLCCQWQLVKCCRAALFHVLVFRKSV